jgi:transcriptional regulator with XRE-family HTH domain
MTKIRENLKKLLSIKSISIPTLAEELDIPFSNLYRMANKEPKRPRKDTIKKLAEYFNVTYDQFMGKSEIKWASIDGWLDLVLMNANRIPLCLWEMADGELNYSDNNSKIVVPTCNSTINTFALKIKTDQYNMFQRNTIIICNPDIKPTHCSLVIIKNKGDDNLYLRKYLFDPRGIFLHLLDKNFSDLKTYKMEPTSKVLATVIHYQWNLSE